MGVEKTQKRGGIKQIAAELGLTKLERFTEPKKVTKKWTKVVDRVPQQQDKSVMADLLELPKTKAGYRYLLVVVDLWSREIEFEPLKQKEATQVRDALKKIFKRGIVGPLKGPAQFQTDGGGEFRGSFHKFIFDRNIYHKTAQPHRHSQQSTVERANRTLGRLFNGYMTKKEEETGKTYREWTDIVPFLRKQLNNPKIRELRKDENPYELKKNPQMGPSRPPKYKVGDLVHRRLDHPEDVYGKKQPSATFRVGDFRYERANRPIVEVIPGSADPKQPAWRYMLTGLESVSYPAWQLMPSELDEEYARVKQLIGRKEQDGKTFYRVWWDGEPKGDATWEPMGNLIKDPVLKKAVELYDQRHPQRVRERNNAPGKPEARTQKKASPAPLGTRRSARLRARGSGLPCEEEKDGYIFRRSTKKHKKYDVFRDGVLIASFGDRRYQHFRDAIGLWSHLDHLDDVRRKRYYARHGKRAVRESPKWFSHNYLW